MVMPHPGVFMIPFGCVIIQTQTRKGLSIDIHREKDEIEHLHDAFARKPNGTDSLADMILATKDDSRARPSRVKCSVIAYASPTLNKTYQAYRLHKKAPKNFDPDPVESLTADEWLVMDLDCHYFLLKKIGRRAAKKGSRPR